MNSPLPMDDGELLDLLLGEEAGLESPPAPWVRHPGPVPLSRAQARLWFLQHLAPESPAYHIPCAVRFTGRLDVAALQTALNGIIGRHEALRTAFPSEAGKPRVRVEAQCALNLPVEDLSGLAERETVLRRRCAEEASRPFDLARAPLLRAGLYKLAEGEHVALLVLHHIVADGWSMGVLLGELTARYQTHVLAWPDPLPELAVQYGDFAAWQADWLAGEEAARQRAWWTSHLSGLPLLDLPADHPRPAEPGWAGASVPFAVPEAVAEALKRLAQGQASTLFMALLAAFAVLLHRYGGQDDIAIGSPVAGRNRRELEPLIGFFVNTLVLRCDLSGRPSFREVLGRVRDFTLEALARQDFPFDEVVRELAPERSGTANPLFQVMFSLEKAPVNALELPGLSVRPVDFQTHTAKFDLLLNMGETAEGLSGAFEYATQLFEAGTVVRMAGHYTRLLEAIAQDPDGDIALLPLLSPEELRREFEDWNGTSTDFPAHANLAELFEQQAARNPDAQAVEFGEQRLSYGELNGRANRLARHLRALGVGLETPVAVHLRRSAEMVVAFLAILKSGGYYVPLDTAYPEQRLRLMLEDCGAWVLLTERALLSRFHGIAAVCLDDDAAWAGLEGGNLDHGPLDGAHLAYVIYTSGSTGAPKGVAVPQRAVSRLVLDTDYVALGADDRIAQNSNASFDAATFEIWGALLNGAQLVGVDRELSLSPPDFARFLRDRGITTLFLTTALFNQMVREAPGLFGSLRQVLFGGEQVDPQAVREVLRQEPPERLLHVYGPTENTTFSTWHRVRELGEDASTVPIGKPIANTRAHVLDARLQLVPAGVVGELYLGGDGLARGYLGRIDLTEERFVPDPYGSGRLYRSGDRVRRLANGDIEFIGRCDSQVKIRGFRIEPGEIEAALNRHPWVREAVVTAPELRPGRRELIAHVVLQPAAEPDTARLREDLAEQLPDYMVPAKYVVLPELPLNENGKVDRARLPLPEDLPGTAGDIPAAPRNAREQALAEVWQLVLGCGQPGIHDNYFALGGDSITAIQLVSRLKGYGFKMRVADLFRHPNIAQLAPVLRETDGQGEDAAEGEGELPLSPIQHWFFQRYTGPERRHFNQAVLLRCSEAVDPRALAQVLAAWLERHDALRLSFIETDGRLRQERRPTGEAPALSSFDLREDGDWRSSLEHHADALQAGLDLERGPLLRAGLFRCPDGDRLLLVIHHLAIDGVSWRVLLDELEPAYRQAVAGQVVDLGPKTCSFGRWALQLQGFARDGALDGELAYWRGIEASPSAPLSLAPVPASYGDTQTLHGAFTEAETRQLLSGIHGAYQTEVLDILLTGLGLALRAWSGADARLIALEGHGREPPDEDLDLSRTVGWFTSLYPFLLAVPGDDIAAQIQGVKAALRAIPGKGVGYGILRYLRGVLEPAAAPELSFNYLGQFGEGAPGGLFDFCDEPSGQVISPELPRAHALDIVALVAKGRLMVSLQFAPKQLAETRAQAFLAQFQEQLRVLIRHCLAKEPAAQPWAGRFAPGEVEDSYPLSPLQEGLLFQSLLDPETEAYFVQMGFRFRGALDEAAFRQALDALSARHGVLRSAFLHQDQSAPLQVVLRERPPGLSFRDLRGMDPAARALWLDEFRRQDRQRGFDLEREVLLRVSVFRCGEEEYQMVWSYHHILLDGWCLGILRRDFLELYGALLDGRPPRLPEAVPYRRYIQWLGRQDRPGATAFWRTYLDGYEHIASPPGLALADEAAPRVLHEAYLDLDEDSSARLAGLAAQACVTLSAVFRALWGLLLSRYNDREDVVFGSIVSGRPADLTGVEDIVGLFINAVPVRVQCQPELGFIDLVRALQDSALAMEAHQHLPLTEIQALSPLGRELFDHMLVFENYPVSAASPGSTPAAGWDLELVSAYDPTHYDFDVTVTPGARISIKFTYRADIYSDRWVQGLIAHWRRAVETVLDDPHRALREIDILPPEERHRLVAEFNPGAAEDSGHEDFMDLFEAQVERVPEAIALVCGETRWTYRELNREANRLAHRLIGLGIATGEPVGLCVERSPEMILGPLAIFKAQGAFVPLDPAYPPERLAHMLEEAQVRYVLTRSGLAGRLPEHRARLVWLDEPARGERGEDNPPRRGDGSRLAYVIFTSGSTGQPKGVAVAHRGLSNMALAWREAYGLDRMDLSLLQLASMSFDVFLGDLVRALSNGGRLVICPAEVQVDPPALYRLLTRHRVSVFESTPGLILPLMDHVYQQGLPLDDLKLLIIGSDLLPARHFKSLLEHFAHRLRIVNSYGVTEATIDSCYFETGQPHELSRFLNTPVGKPLRNTRFYVLDRQLRVQPAGVAGELYIGGAGVALGYLNRPDLTAERFVKLPHLEAGIVYRSGDQVRWLEDGNLEFLGRMDRQLKIRGYRIEPGEIEDRLLRMPGVREAVVLAKDVGGAKDLVAYVVARDGWSAEQAREWLREELPAHMLPPFFVSLDSLPLTPNGKLDRGRLPDPLSSARSPDLAPLRTATEQALAGIWKQVLQVEAVGARDGFFELGGHSLKAMQMASLIHKNLGVEIGLRELFAHPRLDDLAALIEAAAPSAFASIPPAPVQDHYELSHAQRRLWMLHQMEGATAYNMPEAHLIHQAIEAPILDAAFARLIQRHESLRTGFILVDGEPRQQIHPQVHFEVAVHDLREDPDGMERAHAVAARDASLPFDLTAPPLLRASLIQLPGDRSVFVMTLHHIVGDGWSGNVMLRELLALYEALRLGAPDPLRPLPIQYKDFAVWQNARGFHSQEAYWLSQLRGMPGQISLPYDLSPPAQRSFAGGIESLALDRAVTDRLRALARARGTTLSNVLLALFQLFLFQWTRQDDLCVGLSIANRNHPDLENLIGFFVNVLPIRCRLSEDMEFDQLLDLVIRQTQDAFEQQDYPFDLMVEKLNPSRLANRQPLVNVIYGFQNFADVHIEVGVGGAAPGAAVSWEDFDFSYQTAKFDLTLFVAEDADAVRLSLEYDSQLFLAATIREQLETLGHFAGLLAGSDTP